MGRTDTNHSPISQESVREAREAGRGTVKHTPITESAALSEMCGGSVVLKAENLQRTGSFKIRGAMNKIATLGDAAAAGVVAGSAGNHAQALAFAARKRGIPCEIFVPAGASLSKMESVRSHGATLSEGGDTLDAAVARARDRAAATGMNFCHPFDDPAVMAGQATLGLELLEDIPDLARVIIPLGGGGLTGGVAWVLKNADPSIEVIGVQVRACAPYAGMPPADGPIVTLADGIAVKWPGDVTRPVVEKWVDEIVVVEEDSVADAMVLLMDRGKLYVEGGGAVGGSALMTGAAQAAAVISGAAAAAASGPAWPSAASGTPAAAEASGAAGATAVSAAAPGEASAGGSAPAVGSGGAVSWGMVFGTGARLSLLRSLP